MQDWDHYSRLQLRKPTEKKQKNWNFFRSGVKIIFFLFGRFQVHLHQLWAWFSWLQFVMVVWSWLWSSSASSFCVQWHVLGWLDAIKCEMMAVIFVGFLEPPLWFILAWLLGGHAFSFLEYLFSCKSSMMHGEYLVKDHSSCSWCLLMMPASYLHSYLGFLKCQNTKWNSPKKSSFSFAGTFKQIVLKVSSTFASKWASTFHSKNTKSQ